MPPIFVLNVPCAITPTTTTTTVAPITFSTTVSCVGGSGQILANNYAGGNGSYQWIAIANSSATAVQYVNGIGGTRYAAGTSYTFTSLTDGTWYVALRDTAGNVGVSSGLTVNCATTTTTTTTTSTTTTTTTAATRTVRLYGQRTGTLGSSYLFYSINGGTLLGGYTLTTTGTLYATFTVSSGDVVRVFTSPDASNPTTFHQKCAQVATNTYCTGVNCNEAAFTINADTDISVRSSPASTICP